MSELYWVTRVGVLHNCIIAIIIVLAVVLLVALIVCANRGEESEEDELAVIRFFRTTIVAIVLLLVINIFIPSKQDMYIIYGIGGTIDYIKQDSVGKQLPHKVIEACDKFIEEQKGGEDES